MRTDQQSLVNCLSITHGDYDVSIFLTCHEVTEREDDRGLGIPPQETLFFPQDKRKANESFYSYLSKLQNLMLFPLSLIYFQDFPSIAPFIYNLKNRRVVKNNCKF